MTLKKNHYEWYLEEIKPLIEQLKVKLLQHNENMEYAFIIAQPDYENDTFNCCTEYHSKQSYLVSSVSELIEEVLPNKPIGLN